jgi:hypothetical protein
MLCNKCANAHKATLKIQMLPHFFSVVDPHPEFFVNADPDLADQDECGSMRIRIYNTTLFSLKKHLQREEKDLPVQRDDVVLPDHIVDGVDALVDVAAARGLAELVHQEITESAQVGGQLLRADPLQNLRQNSVKCTDPQ